MGQVNIRQECHEIVDIGPLPKGDWHDASGNTDNVDKAMDDESM